VVAGLEVFVPPVAPPFGGATGAAGVVGAIAVPPVLPAEAMSTILDVATTKTSTRPIAYVRRRSKLTLSSADGVS
jgi:hypothetical protein